MVLEDLQGARTLSIKKPSLRHWALSLVFQTLETSDNWKLTRKISCSFKKSRRKERHPTLHPPLHEHSNDKNVKIFQKHWLRADIKKYRKWRQLYNEQQQQTIACVLCVVYGPQKIKVAVTPDRLGDYKTDLSK